MGQAPFFRRERGGVYRGGKNFRTRVLFLSPPVLLKIFAVESKINLPRARGNMAGLVLMLWTPNFIVLLNLEKLFVHAPVFWGDFVCLVKIRGQAKNPPFFYKKGGGFLCRLY